MRSFKVRVTTDIKEYLRWTNHQCIEEPKSCPGTNGLYLDGCIWIKKLNPLTIGHELIHHLIGHSADPWYISLRLFGDFLNTLWDVAYLRLFNVGIHKKREREAVRRIKASLNDWLDWRFCRDV